MHYELNYKLYRLHNTMQIHYILQTNKQQHSDVAEFQCFVLFCFLTPGTILIVVFVRLSYQNPKRPSKTNQERVPLKISI